MPLGHALLAVNSAQTGAITRSKWRFWLKVGVFSSGDRVEINNEAKLDERNGQAPNELIPGFACQSLTRLLLSCCVVDGLCYNELGRVGQVLGRPEFRCALCKKGKKCYGIFYLNGK